MKQRSDHTSSGRSQVVKKKRSFTKGGRLREILTKVIKGLTWKILCFRLVIAHGGCVSSGSDLRSSGSSSLVKKKKKKTIKQIASVASVSVRFGRKERGTRVKDRAKNGPSKRAGREWGRKEGNAVSFLPLPLPHFHFLALVSFLPRPKPRIPFLGLSLLRNQTETLATQAIKQTSKTSLSRHA